MTCQRVVQVEPSSEVPEPSITIPWETFENIDFRVLIPRGQFLKAAHVSHQQGLRTSGPEGT